MLLFMTPAHFKLVLVGLPGSGKSTLGKELAAFYNCPFFDLDEEIVTKMGQSISYLFSTLGEASFREIESNTLKDILLKDNSFVLSTGGGTPCFHNNHRLINEYGVSIYIDVPIHILAQRLGKNGGGKRPMFRDLSEDNIVDKISNLLSERSNYYHKAKIKLSGEDISTELVVSRIDSFFRN